MPPLRRRCARPPGCRSASPPPRSPWNGCSASTRAAFGHRYLFGVIDPGGVSRAPDADALRRELPGAYGELRRAADALLATNSFVDRLEATGILTTEQARRLGLVGPVARAAGLAVDARLNTAVRGADTRTAVPTLGTRSRSSPQTAVTCSPASR